MTLEWSENPKAPLTVNGKQLEYFALGPSPDKAPTIVLLHEGLGCAALWRDFPAKLAEATGMGVFVYSRLGYGQSDAAELPKPLDFMTSEAVDVLPQVLDQMAFERGILMGHSDGATIAAIYAGSVADLRVRGLVLMAPHFFTEPAGLESIRETKKTFETTDMAQKMAKAASALGTFFGGGDGGAGVVGSSPMDEHPEMFRAALTAEQRAALVPVLAARGQNCIDACAAQVAGPLPGFNAYYPGALDDGGAGASGAGVGIG